jgi:hypothetical protein
MARSANIPGAKPGNVRHADLAGPRLDKDDGAASRWEGELGARRGSSFGRPGVLEFVTIASVVPWRAA